MTKVDKEKFGMVGEFEFDTENGCGKRYKAVGSSWCCPSGMNTSTSMCFHSQARCLLLGCRSSPILWILLRSILWREKTKEKIFNELRDTKLGRCEEISRSKYGFLTAGQRYF